MFFVMSLSLFDHRVLHNIVSSSSLFSISLRFSRFFSLVFRTSNFGSLRNLIKQLFHSRLLDMRLVIANSYPTRAHGIIVKYTKKLPNTVLNSATARQFRDTIFKILRVWQYRISSVLSQSVHNIASSATLSQITKK